MEFIGLITTFKRIVKSDYYFPQIPFFQNKIQVIDQNEAYIFQSYLIC